MSIPINPKGHTPKIQSEPTAAHLAGGRSTPNERDSSKIANTPDGRVPLHPLPGGQKWWLVINLKQLNAFVEVPDFKMEEIQTFKSFLKQGDWLVKVDLKDAYNVFLYPDQLGTQEIPMLCSRELYLPFQLPPIRPGLSPLGLYQHLKAGSSSQKGTKVAVDILLLVDPEEKAQDHASSLFYLLQCLRFTINTDQSVIEPFQSVEFLGFTVTTVTMELSLPAKKLKKIRVESWKLLEAGQVSARALSRLIGKMNGAN